MEQDPFEAIVERAFERLPELFRDALENVGVFTEEYPSDELVLKLHLPSKRHLLGLYQGVPLTQRGSWYGMTPVAPDTITLYRKNIESRCRTAADLERLVVDVLIHEIGHYFGMSEEEIRSAGY